MWLIAFLPFLNPIHSWPIPSFYSEWLAVALALVVIACNAARAWPDKLPIPDVALLPLMLTAAVLGQLALTDVSHEHLALLYCCYLLLAAALMVAGHVEAGRFGLAGFAGILATAFVAGSLLQAGIVVLQRLDPAMQWPVFFPLSANLAGGALGQRNHLVNYMWLGIASAAYLTVTRSIPPWAGAAIMWVVASSSVLPGSRSAFLYAGALAALSILAWRRSHDAAWRRIALLCALAVPLMLAADWLAERVLPSGANPAATATERLAAKELDPVRSGLLQVAWLAAGENPLAGHGVGAAPRVTFEHATDWPTGSPPVVAEHFHNLIAQWLVEFGFPLTLTLLAFLLYWFGKGFAHATRPEHWWILSMLAVIGLHSQLEYPLWLSYFLVPTALLAGALSQTSVVRIELRPRHRLIATAGLLAAVVTMASLWLDYRRLETIVAVTGPGANPRYLEQAIDSALALESHSLLSPQIVVLIASAMGVSREGATAKWALCRRALRISPTRDVVFKCTAIAALAGKRGEAAQLADRGMAIYGSHPGWPQLRAGFEELESIAAGP